MDKKKLKEYLLRIWHWWSGHVHEGNGWILKCSCGSKIDLNNL